MAEKSMSFRFRDEDLDLIAQGRKIGLANSSTGVMRVALQHLIRSWNRGEPIHTDVGDMHPPQQNDAPDVK